jgi:hypothetical protein
MKCKDAGYELNTRYPARRSADFRGFFTQYVLAAGILTL